MRLWKGHSDVFTIIPAWPRLYKHFKHKPTNMKLWNERIRNLPVHEKKMNIIKNVILFTDNIELLNVTDRLF
jgi:hypothetical protein